MIVRYRLHLTRGRSSPWMGSLMVSSAIFVATLLETPTSSAGERPMDGVFTEIQASRGQSVFLKECSSCHARDMGGNERIPALAGDTFLRHWQGQLLEKLFTRIKLTMPQNSPQSLSDTDYIDIVAFLLQSNGFPEGGAELTPDSAILKKTAITAVP
jgi:S-disulfanyl-L-cysteine oxidoreductase SoxD